MSTTTRIVKFGDARQLDSDSLYNFDDLRDRCQQHVEAVRAKTRQMILDAEAEAEKLKQQATQQGREEGMQQGLVEADQKIAAQAQELAAQQTRNEVAHLAPTLTSAISKLQEEREYCLSRWEQDGVRLAASIARKLVELNIETHPETATQRLQEMLQLVIGAAHTRVFLSTADMEVLKTSGLEQSLSQNRPGFSFVVDEQMSAGDCRVETEHGEIDGTLESQLNRIVSELCGKDLE